MTKSYRHYLEQLAYFRETKICLGLAAIEKFARHLGHPQKAYPAVLIAGTNGKGSVAAMTASILGQAGYRVGLYTSPHLVDVRERIKVDGKMIPEEEMSRLVEHLRSELTSELTYFEFLTAAAFVYFKTRKVDIAVLEVGLGGRLDATNIVCPLVSVITNIGLDHREYLGDTTKEIAFEKGGIIKNDGVCVTGARDGDALAVIEGICRQRNAGLKRLGREITLTRHRDGSFSCADEYWRLHNLRTPLLGRHQQDNAALAFGVASEMRLRGFPMDEDALRKGLNQVSWAGRMELVHTQPRVYLDGAHNLDGMKVLARTLKDLPRRKLWLVFGVLDDKDYRAMLRLIAREADLLILTRPDSPRAVSPESLLASVAAGRHQVSVIDNPVEAIQRALDEARGEDLIVVAGSLYLVGIARKFFTAHDPATGVSGARAGV
jgi:dihydrofolate synthase/folylpolyglutamate synthase